MIALKGCNSSVGTIDAGVKHEIPMVKPHLAAGTSIPNWEIRHAQVANVEMFQTYF